MTTLTKSERFLLNEVDSVPDKNVNWSLLRQCARAGGLTVTGFSRVADKLLRQNLLTRDYDRVHLTFKGMQALKAVQS